jgi:hypothetical protein
MRRLIAPLLGVALLLSSAGVVAAEEPTIVDPIVCGIFLGGSMTAEPGSPIVIRSGWFASTRGQIVSFMRASRWVVTVDGQPIDVVPLLQGPTQIEHRFWLVTWNYPAGSLALNETMDVTFDLVLNHPNFDGYSLYPVGSTNGGPVHCTVTGAPNPPE